MCEIKGLICLRGLLEGAHGLIAFRALCKLWVHSACGLHEDPCWSPAQMVSVPVTPGWIICSAKSLSFCVVQGCPVSAPLQTHFRRVLSYAGTGAGHTPLFLLKCETRAPASIQTAWRQLGLSRKYTTWWLLEKMNTKRRQLVVCQVLNKEGTAWPLWP